MAPQWHFIVIDDSRLDCFIAERIIQNSGLSLSIKSYNDAREALELIQNSPTPVAYQTVLLVDIQMPLMNGFEFIEAFEKLPAEIQKNYIVNIVTSSANESDLNRMRNYHSVRHLWSKPLTSQAVRSLTALRFD